MARIRNRSREHHREFVPEMDQVVHLAPGDELDVPEAVAARFLATYDVKFVRCDEGSPAPPPAGPGVSATGGDPKEVIPGPDPADRDGDGDVDAADRQQAREMHEAGKKPKEISREFGRSVSTIYRWLREG